MRPSRLLGLVQGVALLAVAVPAAGIAFLAFREATLESGGLTLNRVHHLALGVAMLLLLADFLVAVRRVDGSWTTLALGAVGLVVCLAGAIASEVFGPLALALLLVGGVSWALALICPGSGGRAEQARRAGAAGPRLP